MLRLEHVYAKILIGDERMPLNLFSKKSKKGEAPSGISGEKGHSHSVLYALATCAVVIVVSVMPSLFIYTTSRFDNLGLKIDNKFDNLSTKIDNTETELLNEMKRVDDRIDKWLILKADFSGHVKGESEKRVLTESGREILESEQDFTKLLYCVYDKDPKTYPEDALYAVAKWLGKKKIEKILSDHKISIDILQGIVVSFYGGVKHGKYLEIRPFLKKD